MSVRTRDTRRQFSGPAKHIFFFTFDSVGSSHALQMAGEERCPVIDPLPFAERVFFFMFSSHISHVHRIRLINLISQSVDAIRFLSFISIQMRA